jgi:hypothetical protein
VLLGNQLIAEIYEKYNENKVDIFKKTLQGPLRVLTFVDLAIYSSFNKKTNKFSMFERLFGNKSITFKDGKKVLQTEQINPKFIPLVKSQKIPSEKFITMDLETRTLEDKLSPVCASIYDGKNKSTF